MNKHTKLIAMLTAMLAAGCAESTSAPQTRALNDVTIPGGGATAALTSTDTIRFTFVIDPNRASYYNLGAGNSITFPAGALCDPNRSSYGPGQWDRWCPTATSAVTINAKAWLDRQGKPRLDFDKHVRFVPSNNPANWVMLTLSDYGSGIDLWTNIAYCQSDDAMNCVDESKTDPTVATVTNPVTGKVTRRVKHFSGYSLTSGRDSDSY